MAIDVKVIEPKNLEVILEQLPLAMRGKELERALKAGGRVAQRKAKAVAPVGLESNRQLWSAKTKAQRQGRKQLKDTIALKYKEYGETRVLMVGPAYPAGAHGHLVEDGHQAVFWGRPSNAFIPGKKWFSAAIDSTQTQQHAAIVGSLERAAERITRNA